MSAETNLGLPTRAGLDAGSRLLERHFSPKELAQAWGLNERTVRDIFRDEPGTLKIGQTGRRTKRDHVTLRIPERVALRVYQRRTK